MILRLPEITKIAYLIFKNSTNKIALIGSGISLSLVMIPLIIVYYMSSNIMTSTINKYIESEGFSMQIEYNETNRTHYLKDRLGLLKKKHNYKDLNYFFEKRTYGIIGNNKKQGVLIRAIENKFILENKSIKLIKGTKNLKKDSILISNQIKNKLNLNLNEKIDILIPNTKNDKIMPRIKKFNISGIIETGLKDIDNNLVLISFENENLMSKKFSKSIIGLKTNSNSIKNNEILKQNLETEFQEFQIKTFYELYSNKYNNLDISKKLLIFIMALIIIFASINISSSLSMLIFENKKKIAILKSIGMNNLNIKIIFLLISLTLSTIFCGIGIIIGNYLTLKISYLINFIDNILNFFLKIFGEENSEILNSEYYVSEFQIHLSLSFSLTLLGLYMLINILTTLIPLNIVSNLKEKEILR
ncbi:ABC transporter permease [Borreliella burgdorferi]|uniref:Efflux ABC transporter, permease protein n=1 Tax=Borreliella burgdorferi (strain ZS7) TaxID=445985 RepID=A0A0H3C2L1_BORBZ|nr:ABC transporter permease [Borreliella burgdorferi]ACK74787.1 efflux ABC transporter, permease protein [Borreliella burgdorferi ZS7]EEH31352.1 efflux ABC transporter, permease protein [Borreliella burgdorferi Bol26]MCS2181875.1 ABC transporter permease [Borreliella burgdorferi]PRQ99800.1 ABC transporter permease [Borreliella burgdorferi]PRR21908.1 ABC transporter permease [Borreliella burgdorferi]